MKSFILKICLLLLLPVGLAHAGFDVGTVGRATVSKDGKLFVWDKEGKVAVGWPKDILSDGRYFSYGPRLVDVDLDQKEEIVTVSENKDGGDLKMQVFKSNGTELTNWQFSISDAKIVETPLIADINRDSSPEIIYATENNKVRVFRRDLQSLSSFTKSFDARPRLAVGDYDNNGVDELFASVGGVVNRWDETGNVTELYKLPAGEDIIGNITISYPEIFFSTTSDRVLGIDQNGTITLEVKMPSGVNIISAVVVDDIDVDKESELIITTDKESVLVFKRNGQLVYSWNYNLDYREPALIGGLVANDLYRGLFSSTTGWDQNYIYRTDHNSYSRIKLGENVREWDSKASFDFLKMIEVADLYSYPKPFTPNGDGVNDLTYVNYRLSDDALVALDLYDSHDRFISRIHEKILRYAGENQETWSGVDTKGTVTVNDDVPLATGLYVLKLVAESKDGFVTVASVSAIVNGIKAEIESPKENSAVFGKVTLTGIAVDPNFGEDNLDADFKSYKLYYRPGVWDITADEAVLVGNAGSSWLTLIVPLEDQCGKNDFNEPVDSVYPNSNVSCRPIQHGVLGVFDTTNISNGEYTLLLKVMDSNGNVAGKLSYDTLVVTVANPKIGDPFDPLNPYDANNPNNPKYKGPDITSASLTNANISREDPTTKISYSLANETSNVSITIFPYNNGAYGSAAAVYTFNNLAPNDAGNPNYSFTWNGTNTLGRNVNGGQYKIRIEAHAVDGTGVDTDDSLEFAVATGFSASDVLGAASFTATPMHFNPFNFDANFKAEKTFLTYVLTKDAKVTLQVLEDIPGQGLVIHKTLSSGIIKKKDSGNEFWDGTGDNGVILTVGKDYIVRLIAEGIDIGNTETITKDIVVHLDDTVLSGDLVADIKQLKGDEGELVNKGDELSAIVGNPDFLWRTKGTGYVQMPFSYTISASGKELKDKGCTPKSNSGTLSYHYQSGMGCPAPSYPIPTTVKVQMDTACTLISHNASIINGPQGTIDPPVLIDNGVQYTAQTTVPENQVATKCTYLYAITVPDCAIAEYDCGKLIVDTTSTTLEEEDWGSYSSSGSYSLISSVNNPSNNCAEYMGQVGNGGENPTITSYDFTVSNQVNGFPSSISSNGATSIALPYLTVTRSAGTLSAQIVNVSGGLLTTYNTDELDPYLSSIPYKKIWSTYRNFNDDYFHNETGSINIYNDGYKTNVFSGNPGTNLYSFSDVVHINAWDIDVRYPNVSVDKADGDSALDIFEIKDTSINSTGVRGAQNANVDDTFRLRLKPTAVPKKFVEIWGSAGANYELYYYDGDQAEPSWVSIATRTHNAVSDGLLAHWDVTRLNGENYTVVLKTKSGNKENIARFNIGIGTRVDTSSLGGGEVERVYSPFKRASLIFGKDSLQEGTALVTINTINPSEADHKLPTGIAPLGPIFDIKPDGIKINPQHHVQLELTFTPSEIKEAFGVADASQLTIYNLAGDEILEGLATVITFDDMDDSDPTNDVWRFTANLEHFSEYFLARKDAGFFHITQPTKDSYLRGAIDISGKVTNTPDANSSLANLTDLTIGYYPDGDLSSKAQIYTGTDPNIAVNWDVSALNGNYILRFEASGPQGADVTYEIPVAIDNTPTLSTLIINGNAVAGGETVYAARGSIAEIKSSDSAAAEWQSGVKAIEYSLDGGTFTEYTQPFVLDLSNGDHSIAYHAIDNNGNVEADRSASVIIQEKMQNSDQVSLNFQINGPSYNKDNMIWANNETKFTITSQSPNIDHISYRAGGAEYQTYVSSFSIQSSGEGSYSIEYFAVDGSGLRGDINTRSVILDVTSPVSVATIDGLHQDLNDELIVTPQTSIALSAKDDGDSPSGLNRIEYKIDDDAWQVYKQPLTFGKSAKLSYRSVDDLGNYETEHVANVHQDDVAPTFKVINFSAFISPNGDGRFDTAELAVNVSENIYQILYLKLELENSGGEKYTVFDNKEIHTGENKTVWDGKVGGELIPENIYKYTVTIADDGGNISNAYSGYITYDVTPPNVTVINGTIRSFSPNGDAQADILQVDYSLSDNLFLNNISIKLEILTLADYPVSSTTDLVSLPPNDHSISWNGSNALANGVFDGNYEFQLIAEDPAGNRSQPSQGSGVSSGDVFIDRYAPKTTILITGPAYNDTDKLWLGQGSLISFEAVDPTPASGLDKILYYFNADAPQAYSAPLSLAKDNVDHVLNYHSSDMVGNLESLISRNVRSDKNPPTTTIIVGEPKDVDSNNKLFVSPKTPITFDSEDEDGVGVKQIYTAIAGLREPSPYYGEVNLAGLGDGVYDFFYWADDFLNNVEERRPYKINLDGTPPVTTLIANEPKVVDEDAIYLRSTTAVSFEVVTNRNDLKITKFKIDDGEWKNYTGSFNLTEEGEHTLSYQSYDRLDNAEALKTQKIIVDDLAPKSEINMNQTGGGNYITPTTLITLAGSDNGSKVKNIEYKIDDGDYVSYTAPFSLSELTPGAHTITYRVTDRLGNVSENKIATLELIDVLVKVESKKMPRVLVFMLQTQDLMASDPRPNEDLIRNLETELGGYLKIITGDHNDAATIEQFISEMRSDKYNIFIFATDAFAVNFYDTAEVVNMLEELKSRIFKGDTLINLVGYSDVRGTSWTNFISGFENISDTTYADNFVGFENAVELSPAKYGNGLILKFGADLGRLDLGAGFADLIMEAIPQIDQYNVGEVIDLVMSFENKGPDKVNIHVSDVFPDGWIETATTNGEVAIKGRGYDIELPAAAEKQVDYLYRVGVDKGTYDITSDISAKWLSGLTSGNLLKTPIVVENNILGLIDALKEISDPDIYSDIQMLEKRLVLGDRLVSDDKVFSEMIALALDVINKLTSSNSNNKDKIHLLLSELIENLGVRQTVKSLSFDISVDLGDPNDPASYHGNTTSYAGAGGGGCSLIKKR